MEKALNMFPYHYGSYATVIQLPEAYDFRSFHTTMVLTQQAGNEEYPALDIMFPYHYGSYKSRPPLTVQEHEPVHRKDQRSDPEQEHFRMTN